MSADSWWSASSFFSVHPDDRQSTILLGRRPTPIPLPFLEQEFHDATVVVTGAGGFIGSEICRTLVPHCANVVGLDISEHGLATLADLVPELRIELADIRDSAHTDRIFAKYQPTHVFHTAAYKHVPFLESHLVKAIANNALATYETARSSIRAGVKRFLFISSDKAAAAANVLGMSKRLAEVMISGLPNCCAKFAAVRCANVLGSPGSILPRFLQQLSRGEPLTVTTPTGTRYFMTVKESVHAIIAAMHLMEGREIFIPEAGEPVRIADFAEHFIASLPGSQRGSVAVLLTGLRPGDQDTESLISDREHVDATKIGGLRLVRSPDLLEGGLSRLAETLRELCISGDEGELRSYIQSVLLSG